MEHGAAEKDDGIPRDDEDGEPGREFSIMRVDLAPVADAQGDDSAKEKALDRNGIENCAERAALIVSASHVAIEAIAHGRQQKHRDSGEAHPILGLAFLDAFAVVNRECHEYRNHQDPDYGYLVSCCHGEAASYENLTASLSDMQGILPARFRAG